MTTTTTTTRHQHVACFSDKRPEQSIAAARASVMVYDDINKKWIPAGSSHGLSKVKNILTFSFFVFLVEISD